MSFTLDFVALYWQAISLTAPLLLCMCFVIIGCGQLVGWLEGWTRFNAFYWSFVTALTIGYGDIRPTRKASKLISIFIGFVGLILTGIMISMAVFTASEAFADYAKIKGIELKVPQFSP